MLIRLPIFTSLGMGLESVYLYLMTQSRPVFPTSRLLVSPNSMVWPHRWRRRDCAFCFGLLYVAFLNQYLIFSYTKEHGEFQRSYLRLYVISRPIFTFLRLRLFLQYRLQVKLRCLNYCVFRLLRVCDSFIDHETSCDIKSSNQWFAFCLFLLWGVFYGLGFPSVNVRSRKI